MLVIEYGIGSEPNASTSMLSAPSGRLNPSHPDHVLVTRLEDSILSHAGGLKKFSVDIPRLLRQAIDEVIDSARSNRFTISEIEKTEKTYLGTKIEILLRNHLKFAKGQVLDLLVDGVEVDIKNTIGRNWTIPSEALGHPCILLKSDEHTSLCSFGIIVIREEILNNGRNRDGKRTISKDGLEHVHWLLKDAPYPDNFWEKVDPEIRLAITTPTGGTARVAAIFRIVQNRPIPRLLIEAVGQQRDYMKRLRKNGGARDVLAREGIAILWGQKDRHLISDLGLPSCSDEEFISFRPSKLGDRQRLRESGHLS